MQTQRVTQPDGNAEKSPSKHRVIIGSNTGLRGVVSVVLVNCVCDVCFRVVH